MQNQKTKITIITRLNKGVSDENAGVPTEVWEWDDVSEHDLIEAVETLQDVCDSNEQSWGNIGCGRSWIEIDGIAIGDIYLHDELTVPEAREILSDPREYAAARS